MATEQERTTKGLQTAIRMEVDGKQYYLKASQESTNELGKKLLQTLAGEEDIHRQKFEQIYHAIQQQQSWPEVSFQPDRGKKLKTVFAQATEKMKQSSKGPATELEAIQTAMSMENKTYDFYKSQSEKAAGEVEKAFYETVAGEERIHHQFLLDYYEYLKNPAAWFVSKEHHSLDGG